MKRAALSLFAGLAILAAAPDGRAQEKFSLSLFHFNVQYVAGGLKGFPSGSNTDPVYDLDDAAVQDLIITESLEPVLDLFLKHPGWSVTLEMQAYLVEVIEQRHPQVLKKMKDLQSSGQLELVSFHYSDQLFLAYPRLDMERSHDLLEVVFERNGLRLSPVVFCQEGQFGEGMEGLALSRGRTVLVLAKNLFRYQHLSAYDTAAALYRLGGADVVIGGRSFAAPEVEVRWSFLDDGELLATGGVAPYLPSGFKHKPEAVAEYEERLQKDEADGFRIAKIADFVSWAKSHGLPQPELPPMLDGTWQPPSTDSMRRWLGGSGVVDTAYQCERDNQVLTANVRTRHWLTVAEALVQEAERRGSIKAGSFRQAVSDCWKIALLGQVSDATGINPFINEVTYGLQHAADALDCADSIIGQVAPKLGGPFLLVDTAVPSVESIDERPSPWLQPCQPPAGLADGIAIVSPGRETKTEWSCSGSGAFRLRLTATAASAGERQMEIAFPLKLQGFYLTPGLVENQARFYPFSQFELQEGRIGLPLANGLVGLDESLWLIKQTSSVHLAATFFPGDGFVRFRDDTLAAEETVEWIFWIWAGDLSGALGLAERLNLRPTAVVETGASERGCQCSGLGRPAGLLFVLPIVLWAVRRKTKPCRPPQTQPGQRHLAGQIGWTDSP